MKFNLVFIAFLVTFFSFSQERDNDPFYVYENIPSSPEAGKLGAFTDLSAASYNGKANINIPIYVVEFDGLKIPLQLNYNSGGVKVAEEASWVGLNWSLSSVFGISRKIYGFDDFSNRLSGNYTGAPQNGFIYNDISLNLEEGAARPYMDLNDILNVHHSFDLMSFIGSGSRFLDTQPDLFSVSLFGTDYTFILEKKEGTNILNARVFNNNNVKLTLDLSNMSFTLIDESGFTYHFGTKEINTTFSTVSSSSPSSSFQSCIANIFGGINRMDESLITFWSLDKIVSPRGKVLDFAYQKGLHFTFPHYSFDHDGRDQYTRHNWPTGQYQEMANKINHNVSTTVIENNYLSTISGDFGQIIFNLGNRQDISTGSTLNSLSEGAFGTNILRTSQSSIKSCHGSQETCLNSSQLVPKKLNSIQIKNSQGAEIIDLTFDHSYFNPQRINDLISERYIRLKLDGVLLNGKKYSFNYMDENILPAKDSDGVDFWGFNNGRIGNDGFVPRIGRFITSYISKLDNVLLGQSFLKYPGADRGSDFSFGKAGLLNQIIYPTGGSTIIEYEPHDIVLASPAPFEVTQYFPNSDRYQWTNMTDESKFNITYQYLKNAQDENYNYFEKTSSLEPGNSVILEQEVNEVFTIDFQALLEIDGIINTYTGWEGISFWGSYPILVVEEINSGQERTVFTYADAPSYIGAPANNVSKTIALPPGDYRVVARWATLPPGENYGDYPPIPAVGFTSNDILLYTNESSESYANFFERFEVGGARIRKIINKDYNGEFLTGVQYSYEYPDSYAGLSSSGILMDELIFHKKATGFHSYNPRAYRNFFLTGRNEVGGQPSAQGSHIGYSLVRETKINESNGFIGWIDREYHNQKNEYFKDSFCLPFSYDSASGSGDPYISVLGYQMKWTCSGLDFGNNCVGNVTLFSSLGNSCIQNTVLLGLPLRESFGYANGNLLKESVYNSTGDLLSLTKNDYAYLKGNMPSDYFSSFMNLPLPGSIQNENGEVSSVLQNTSEGPWGANHSTYFPYLFPLHHGLVSKVSGTEKSKFLENGDLVTENISFYNNYTQHLTKTVQMVDENEQISQNYIYPYDDEVYLNNGMADLIAANRLSEVVKTNSFRNSLKLSTIEYKYDRSAQTGYRTLVTSVLGAKGENALKSLEFYQKYDSKGNLIQKSIKDGPTITYLLGYSKQHPIAKIENATYLEVANALGVSTAILDSYTEANLTAINGLRSSLPQAMVTTYTYQPLVGVTSITDPKGYTIYYEYDNFNRLKRVKDAALKILNETEYKYKIQP